MSNRGVAHQTPCGWRCEWGRLRLTMSAVFTMTPNGLTRDQSPVKRSACRLSRQGRWTFLS